MVYAMLSQGLKLFNKNIGLVFDECCVSLKKTGSRNLYNTNQHQVCNLSNFNFRSKETTFDSSQNYKQFSQSQQDVKEDSNLQTKLLKIAIIGTPNTGKSTFINQIVGRRVFAISSKVHTTRMRARAVLNLDMTQVVFLDTPGLVSQTESNKHQLEGAFLKDGELAMTEANIVGVMHDASNKFTRDSLDPKVLRLLHLYPYKHTVLILNKVDAVKKKRVLLNLTEQLTCKKLCEAEWKKSQQWPKLSEDEVIRRIKDQAGWPYFQQVFMVSSLEGLGISEVMEYLLQLAKPGAWVFPENVYTDQKPEQVICDAVTSRLLDHLPQEVPYNCKVQIELYNQLRDGTIMSVVLISCPNVRCEKMLLKKIRSIALETEAQLRNTFMTQVLVKLVVQTAEKDK